MNAGKPKGNFWDGHFPDRNTKADHFAGLAPVASFTPNGYKLYDMAGNVWEWTADWYDKKNERRVVRGGSWNVDSRVLRAANGDNGIEPGLSYVVIGFRVVREA